MAVPSNSHVVDALPETTSTVKEDKKDHESKEEKASQVSFLQLFRYATPLDKLMMFLGSIGAVGHGSAMPIMTILYSDIIQAFLDFSIAKSRGDDLDLA